MGYHHLTTAERCQIYALMSTGMTQEGIAKNLDFSKSTLSREIKRNSGKKGYRYKQADEKAIERRYQASHCPKRMTPAVILLVEEKLIEKWSPEQIAGTLRSNGIPISYESIYRHVWSDKKAGGNLHTHLRHRGKKIQSKSS